MHTHTYTHTHTHTHAHTHTHTHTHRIPTSSSSKLSLGALRRDNTSDVNLSQDELLTTCSILCTADYCLETIQQLESKLKEKIDAPLASKVNFDPEQDNFHRYIYIHSFYFENSTAAFLSLSDSHTRTRTNTYTHSIVSSSIQLLVQDTESACASAFQAMVKVNAPLTLSMSCL